jgi:gluconolactonase
MKICRDIFVVVAVLLVVSCAQQQVDETSQLLVETVTATGDGSILRVSPEFDQLLSADAVIEELASGFGFTEGPHWIEYHGLYGGAVLFSDIPGNQILLWSSDHSMSSFLTPVFEGENDGGFVGSNGITTDAEGRVLFTEHGNRRISRIEPDGSRVVVVDSYQGKRLNSPNDLVFHSNGSLYFTDPPYGLAQQDDDPAKELAVNGIYRVDLDGKVDLLASQTRPNGLAFSPDETKLYVANSDARSRQWLVYDVENDGMLGEAHVFADVTNESGQGSPDGLKVDVMGNLWGTGPGGVWVFSPDGEHLGTIQPTEQPTNVTFGGGDGRTLFMTAQTGFYRVRVQVSGAVR